MAAPGMVSGCDGGAAFPQGLRCVREQVPRRLWTHLAAGAGRARESGPLVALQNRAVGSRLLGLLLCLLIGICGWARDAPCVTSCR